MKRTNIISWIWVTLVFLSFSACKEEVLDTVLPTISILSPAQNAEIVEGSILTIRVEAHDNVSIKRVDLFLAGNLYSILTPPYEMEWDTHSKLGSYTIGAEVFDASNNRGQCEGISFKVIAAGTLADADGNIYNIVTIGTQVWMLENLKTTKYNDGTDIPLVTDTSSWWGLTTSAYCWYNNDIANKAIYGALYNGYTVGTARLAPTGWHVPSDAEWTQLTSFLGGESVAGGKLKETGFTHWNEPNDGATNITGFTALPGGFLNYYFGSFSNVGNVGYWWSSTMFDGSNKWSRNIGVNGASASRYMGNNANGFSVRCIRD